MAQGMLEQKVATNQLPWLVDSAGTNGYHDGESPDPRAIQAAAKRGISIHRQISRRIQIADLDRFDLILAMDRSNLSYLHSMCTKPGQLKKIRLLMEFAEQGNWEIVPDPYYDNRFDHALDLIEVACDGLVKHFNGLNTTHGSLF